MSTPEEIAALLSAERLDAVLEPLLGDLVLDAAIIAQEEAPVAKRDVETGPLGQNREEPGKLRESLEPFLDGGELRGGVTTSVPYARFVEEGTDPHVITARNAPFLHFLGANGWVQKRTVNHPGTAADPFMERTLEKIQPRIGELGALAGAEFFGAIK